MATFNLPSAGDISLIKDWSKVQSYLYKLQEQLRYMFNNLTPEDNYSSAAYLKVVSDGEKQSIIEQSVDGIKLQMVDKDNVVSAINLSREEAQIMADKISLEGVVTVNSYFQIGLDGSMTARNGKFSGNITASTMNSSSITLGGSGDAGTLIVLNSSGTEIGRWSNAGISVKAGVLDIKRGSNIGLYCDGSLFQFGDFEVNDGWGRQILESSDEMTGMSGYSEQSGALYLWAGYRSADNYKFVVNETDAYVMYNGTKYPIGETLAYLMGD